MKYPHKQDRQVGFSVGAVLGIVLVLAMAALAGCYVWEKSHSQKAVTHKGAATPNEGVTDSNQNKIDETKNWVSATTQDKAFTMKIPDGWRVVKYPGDFLGAGKEVVYTVGTPATVETSSNEYVGHSLRFRASITALDDAGLGPQWSSPQTGLEESTQEFSIGALKGKRFKGTFSSTINQTLYEYVFSLDDGKKLDIVYTIYRDQGEEDDVATVEKAIRTLQLDEL